MNKLTLAKVVSTLPSGNVIYGSPIPYDLALEYNGILKNKNGEVISTSRIEKVSNPNDEDFNNARQYTELLKKGSSTLLKEDNEMLKKATKIDPDRYKLFLNTINGYCDTLLTINKF